VTDFLAALKQILPASAVITDPAEKAPFETDWRRLYHNPAICAVLPDSAGQISAILRLCADHKIAVVPQGGNTGLVAGGVPAAGPSQIVLNLRRMNKILGVDTAGDTITVQAGVTLQAVQEAASDAGRFFPVSLGAEGSAQIGGVISTNAGGIQVLSYGSMRAQVLGLEVMLADGRIWNGLRRLRKDNTGFDLKQIFIGGEGALGIVTAAVLRLSPAIRARATALIGVASVEAALAVFQALRGRAGQALTMCEFISGAAMALSAAHISARLPFAAADYVLAEVSDHATDAPVTALLEGALAPLLETGAATDAAIAQSERERNNFLRLREGVPEGELAGGGALKHDIAVPLTHIPNMVRAVEALIADKFPRCRLNIFGHLGDGNLHINVRPPPGQTIADLAGMKMEITDAVETLAVSMEGSFSAEHGIGQTRIPGMAAHKSAVELDLMRALKAALDPANLLNPGKVLPP
jgi:FAD/FMN-containing dehydrogenase